MKPIFTFLTALLLTFAGQAQTSNGRVSGSVQDGSQKNLEAATITLLKAKDSSVAKIVAADKTGKFGFENIAEGKYLVSATAVGHQKGFSETFEINPANTSISLKAIVLNPQSKSIGGVTVTARRPLIEQKIDRTVLNVEASVTNVGNSALEVLEKAPGVTVDKDGNISLKGKDGVMVMVDGRPTQLSGPDLANLLRSMNAGQLDQIEIMTNPPARYDAAGNAGIINIKTKKTKTVGYNGTIGATYGQGRYPKMNENLSFNYRQGKVNVFTNLSHGYRKNFGELNIQRNFRSTDTKQILSHFDQEARMTNEFSSYNAKLGMDYFAGKNTTFGVVFNGASNPGTFTNRNFTLISDASGQPDRQARALSIAKEQWKHFSTNLNFRQVLDTTGKELTADVDYIRYSTRTDQNMVNSYYNAFGQVSDKADTLFGALPQDINIYIGRVDYVHPLKGGARFEAGLKSNFVKTDNNAIYDTLHNGRVMRDYNRSNYFIYEENINAAYVNLSKPLTSKLSAQFGLRLENTNAKGNQVTTGEKFDRHYTQLFPTAFFQYTASKNHTFGLNYGRRIRRPNYENLNPFIEFLDRYTYQQGNPNLKPQFSHNVELSHTFRNAITTTLNYTRTTDIMQQVLEQNAEKNETFMSHANIASQRQVGLAISAGTPITKWWTSNIYVNGFYNQFEGIVDSVFVSVEAATFVLNGSQQFKIGKTTSAEISGWFRSAGIEGVLETRPMGMLSVGASQQIMKGKGTLRLNIRDVLYTQKFQAKSRYGTVDAAFQEARDSRVVNIGFTYRFSKGKINGNNSRKRNSNTSEEQSRVGGGGN
jgi:iron complex outermembrane receptor protein